MTQRITCQENNRNGVEKQAKTQKNMAVIYNANAGLPKAGEQQPRKVNSKGREATHDENKVNANYIRAENTGPGGSVNKKKLM